MKKNKVFDLFNDAYHTVMNVLDKINMIKKHVNPVNPVQIIPNKKMSCRVFAYVRYLKF